jgi:hypothetical protein
MKKDYKIISYLLFTLALIATSFNATLAQSDGKIPFQGVLYEAGEPVTATKQMIFSIASVSWTETHSVSVVNGLYSVVLGEITPFPENLFETSNTASLGINVAGSALPPVEIHAPFLNEAIVARNMPDQVNALSITVSNDNGDKRGELINTHSGNDSGSLRLYGANDNTNVILGSSGGGLSGLLGLYDPEGNPGIDVRVWNNGTGNIYTYGEHHFQTAQLGGFSGQGFLKIEEPNTDGTTKHAVAAGFWSGRPELILELGQDDQKVNINIGNDPGGNDPDGFSGGMTLSGTNTRNIEMGGKNWETNGSNLPYMKMIGTDDNDDLIWMDVSQDTNTGDEWGSLNLRGTDGSEFGINSHGFTGSVYNMDFSTDGYNSGISGGSMNFTSTSGNSLMNYWAIGSQHTDKVASQISLRSDESMNIQLSAKTWEENGINLPFMKMVGTGDDMIWMEVGQDTNTSREWGSINFMSSDGASTNINADGISLNGPDGEYFGIDYNGISGDIEATRLGGPGVGAGEKDWEPGIQGFVHLYGETPTDKDNIRISMEVSGQDAENSAGNLNLFGPVFNDSGCTSCPQNFFSASVNKSDENGGDPNKWYGNMSINGHNTQNINFGAKQWEDNNGADRPYMQMHGSFEIDNGEGGTHLPSLVSMQVDRWDNGSEVGSISFTGTDGSEFGINSHGFTNTPQVLEAREIIALKQQSNEANNSVEIFNNGDAGHLNINNSNNENSIVMNGDNGNIDAKGSLNVGDAYNGSGVSLQNSGHLKLSNRLEITNNDDENNKYDVVQAFKENNYGIIDLFNASGNVPSISLQGGSGDISAGGQINVGDAYDNGVVLNKDFPRIQIFSGGSGSDDGNETINLNGDNGSIDATGGIRSFNNMSVWFDNGGGDDEYALTNVITGGQDGAVYGNIYLKDDLGHSLNLSGEGTVSASGDIITGGSIHADKSINIGGNTFDGELNVSAMTGTSGLRMYADFDGIDQQGSRGHIAVDGAGGNHVWMWGDGTISATGDISASGDIRAGGGAITLNGNGHISASTIDATNTSDKRFKKNIKPIEGALAKSIKLNGNSYQWNELAEKEKSLKENQNKIGVIAQEVELLFPELVETDKKGYKSVDYAGLTAVLLEAVKELSAKVTTLQSENSDLKASMKKLSQLESKIHLIEKLLINKPVDTSKSTALK